jgi:phosphoglycolate phosphatase
MTETKFTGAKALIFDLDGTLIDSKLDLVISVNATLAKLGREALPEATVASYVGSGAGVLMQRALGGSPSEEQLKHALNLFLEHYSAHMLDNTRTYPGVETALAQLKNFPMAVLTNIPVRASMEILAGLGLSRYFKKIYGGNSFETKKPDPLGAKTILGELGVAADRSVMVGDSEVDVQTARNTGMLAAIVEYGFGTHNRAAYPADVYLTRMEDLVPLVMNGTR